MTDPTDTIGLIAQADAALEGVSDGRWPCDCETCQRPMRASDGPRPPCRKGGADDDTQEITVMGCEVVEDFT